MTDKEYNNKLSLASLASKKGFESKFLYGKPYRHSSREKERWFFWLHEVRKWLYDNHKINVEAEPDKALSCEIRGWKGFIDTENYARFMWDLGYVHPTEEDALKVALESALNLLPDID